MKWKLSQKQKLLCLLIVETVFLFFVTYQVISSFFPGNKTFKANSYWRPNPTWKGGLNTTYRLAKDFSWQNVSYPDLNLVAMQGNVAYWVNQTVGSDAEVDIVKWFEDDTTEFFYSSSGAYTSQVYVGSKGEPTSIIGASSSSYTSNIVTFSVASPQTVALFWTSYNYVFHGLYNETTGLVIPSGVNVTAYFTDGTSPTSFEVNGTATQGFSSKPEYFHFELGANDREYWLGEDEDNAVIYIFDDTLTDYTFEFVDLAGALDEHPFVEAQYYINGTLRTVEKRKVDVENKASFSLVNGRKYTIVIQDSANYIYGDLLMTSTTTVTLTLKGIEFPDNIILAFRYVRLYAERHNNFTSISLLYEDLDENTDNVVCNVKYRNGTVAYTSTQNANNFNVTWTSADYSITYFAEMTSTHNDYGTLNYRAAMYSGSMNQNPWNLDFLGTIPGMNTSDIIPAILILFVAGLFSKVNAYVAAFLATIVAIFLTWWGWISITPGLLMGALFFSMLMGMAYKKLRVTR